MGNARQWAETMGGPSLRSLQGRVTMMLAFPLPPFAKCAKDGAPFGFAMPTVGLEFGLGFAGLDGFVEELFHLARGFFRQFGLLFTEFALLFAEGSLFFSEGAHFLAEFALLIAGVGLDISDLALQFADLFLDVAYLLDGGAGAELLQFGFEFVELG